MFREEKDVAATETPLALTLICLVPLSLLVSQQPIPFQRLILHPVEYPFCSSVKNLFP